MYIKRLRQGDPDIPAKGYHFLNELPKEGGGELTSPKIQKHRRRGGETDRARGHVEEQCCVTMEIQSLNCSLGRPRILSAGKW